MRGLPAPLSSSHWPRKYGAPHALDGDNPQSPAGSSPLSAFSGEPAPLSAISGEPAPLSAISGEPAPLSAISGARCPGFVVLTDLARR
ncbi:skin secretory protein xP2-like [Hemiscyllium ocellatum]|uniref:skin secretory protein xP2-like n=1 Tax=Hemiscyllium ocellatum TaxID=170820 RepID=UPI0029667541|nr:skin secretory protein xP2-like [Hemiscyllium ocellatum]